MATTTAQPTAARTSTTFNIAQYLPQMAATVPGQAAVVTARYDRHGRRRREQSLTFARLDALSNRYANALEAAGFTREMRVLLMVRPGITFTGLVFAMFKMGLVPVMIDPGMGASRMLECIRGARVQGLIGIPLAHLVRIMRKSSFSSLTTWITVGRRWAWGGPQLENLARQAGDQYTISPTTTTDPAAILFTSGSTGPAKGVEYEHGMFGAQVEAIQSHYDIEPGEVDLPGFPLFALFSTAMGMTCIIPDMDPSRPARVNPVKIVRAIQDYRVTSTFGSPAIWKKVIAFCRQTQTTLPTLRRVLVAGAPIRPTMIEQFASILTGDADVHTPFGATESLPVSSIAGRELRDGLCERARQGQGICVGRPVARTRIRVVAPLDKDQPDPGQLQDQDAGEVGEIIVSGPVVTRSYFHLDKATRAAKLTDADGALWHRIGDLGYIDDEGRLWFCGRHAHAVLSENGLMCSVRCEAIFNEHPHVERSALVGTGPPDKAHPVMIVEPVHGHLPRPKQIPGWERELRELARGNELTRTIDTFLFHPSFPVDVRHNAKVNREQLAEWAAERIQ